jgi:MarR family transcriptional regulator, organic hydroperoxide resistance regulator
MKEDVLLLKNQLCFPLYASSREVIKKYKEFLDPLGLTYTQYIAMMVLWEQKSAKVKLLGEQLHLDSGTLSPLLKKMEIQGLLSRNRDATDERNVIVTITHKGEILKEQAIKIPEKIGACINLDKEEAKTLYTLLYKVLGVL